MKNVTRGLALFLGLILLTGATTVNAETVKTIYEDTDQGRIVYDVDEYLELLNTGEVKPYDAHVIEGEMYGTMSELSEPSESCSNVFGHKWDSWGGWNETSRIHFPQGNHCLAKMERWRFCSRKHCKAYQIESDSVWVVCNH